MLHERSVIVSLPMVRHTYHDTDITFLCVLDHPQFIIIDCCFPSLHEVRSKTNILIICFVKCIGELPRVKTIPSSSKTVPYDFDFHPTYLIVSFCSFFSVIALLDIPNWLLTIFTASCIIPVIWCWHRRQAHIRSVCNTGFLSPCTSHEIVILFNVECSLFFFICFLLFMYSLLCSLDEIIATFHI